MDPDRRWEAGRLAVASAQDILSRTIPKPQSGQQVEHSHQHVHVQVPAELLNAVKALPTNGFHEHEANKIIDISEPEDVMEVFEGDRESDT
jgi:hypothetical protein